MVCWRPWLTEFGIEMIIISWEKSKLKDRITEKKTILIFAFMGYTQKTLNVYNIMKLYGKKHETMLIYFFQKRKTTLIYFSSKFRPSYLYIYVFFLNTINLIFLRIVTKLLYIWKYTFHFSFLLQHVNVYYSHVYIIVLNWMCFSYLVDKWWPLSHWPPIVE